MTLKKRHFTLIELLVVMGLIGLLVTLAVPSFTRLAKGKATPVAADQIKRQLEEAQALAIAHRSYVGLIIPNDTDTAYYGTIFASDDSPDFSSNTKNQYYFASTRPALLFKDGSDYYFEKWAPDSSWSKPIENAKIVKITDFQSNIPDYGNPLSDKTGNISSLTDSFSPTGAFYSVKRPSGSDIGPCAVVFSPDGGLAATQDLYLVIAGCTVSVTDLKFPSDTDYLVLHINRMNGKITYFEKK
ncbi:MAG: type II secretion system GspH family protein [Victivallaceae bacterium]|nr:type II secretion system GspH family protein [Victivallaceae bacterium]